MKEPVICLNTTHEQRKILWSLIKNDIRKYIESPEDCKDWLEGEISDPNLPHLVLDEKGFLSAIIHAVTYDPYWKELALNLYDDHKPVLFSEFLKLLTR